MAIWRKRMIDGRKRSNSSQAHEKTRRNKRRYPLTPPRLGLPKNYVRVHTEGKRALPRKSDNRWRWGRNTPKSLGTSFMYHGPSLRTASVTVFLLLSTGLSPFFVADMGGIARSCSICPFFRNPSSHCLSDRSAFFAT